MRLASAGYRGAGPSAPSSGHRIWLVTCIVTVLVAVVVAAKVTASGCPGQPRAGGTGAAAGGAARGAASRAAAGRRAASPPAASPALAASVVEGRAVFYDPGRAAGSCGLGPFPAAGWYASLPPRSYASGRACGSYLDVYGPRGTVRAEVVDVCPGCAAGTVDLSRAAFARIASPGTGTVAVSYRVAVNPPLAGPLALRIDAAGRAGGLAVQVINHGNRLASVAAGRPGGRWQPLAPSGDGYWTGPLPPGGPAGGRIRVRVTDIAGHQVVLSGISPRSTVLHASTWMYQDRVGTRAGRPPGPAASPARPAARPGRC